MLRRASEMRCTLYRLSQESFVHISYNALGIYSAMTMHVPNGPVSLSDGSTAPEQNTGNQN